MSIGNGNEVGSKRRPATWIWYPGDYEMWLHRKVSVLRQYKGYICPPSWRLDDAYSSVKFRRTFPLLERPLTLKLAVQGEFVLLKDGGMTPIPYERGLVTTVTLPAGTRELRVDVYNDKDIPALYAAEVNADGDESGAGDVVGLKAAAGPDANRDEAVGLGDSGSDWEVTAYDGKWVNAASWTFDSVSQPPGPFPFAYETFLPVETAETADGGKLFDFGRETFGYLRFPDAAGPGKLKLVYGESREEALAGEAAETFDELIVGESPNACRTPVTRAFRFVHVTAEGGADFSRMDHDYEYLPVEARGRFRCSDERLNAIWDVSAHTIHLNMREFLFDGIKRDRWVWSGDANIGLMINNYLFFEQDLAKRTLIALRGKDPVAIHINTIMDFTFYWFLTYGDYYMYTGDLAFVRGHYDKMLTTMEFCLGRRNEEGMMEGRPEDWVFIDWAPMELRGEVCAEQLLLCRSLETMAYFAAELGDEPNRDRFAKLAESLRARIFELFWDDAEGALLHGRFAGELVRQVLRYPNLFAARFGYLDEPQGESIRGRVLMNDGVQKIKTPFMRFFELEALCQLGEHDYVLNEIRGYWGGMLDLGATSFWEEYDPQVPTEEQYDMYGDKFRKSLCHAWGAAPILLLGKALLGIRPTEPGYARYVVEPRLCDLEWVEGAVPTPQGNIGVYVNRSSIRVTTGGSSGGVLRFYSGDMPQSDDGMPVAVGENQYELPLTEPYREYVVRYNTAFAPQK